MIISLNKPSSISEIGRRNNNEDSIYPRNEEASVNDKLFLVCDGVGGANKGEVASALACESIKTYFRTFLEPEKTVNAEFIEKSIRYAETRFDEYVKENPEARGMATTVCLIYLSANGIFLTHAGDSRIYQIRNGNIIFKTEDHSLVNSWIKTGRLDVENARNHPQKNVIYRAIQSSRQPVEIDVTQLTDIRPGDAFLMCTDGIYDAISEKEICEILNENGNAESKLTKIKESCSSRALDNYSAYLIPIQDVQDSKTFKQFFVSFLYAFV
ncbi:MAG: protein phosphatase 2C domain-containing protein [Dysgonamonadaceae bacterium]|jgi:protein phosphatase|nr:protein phosphatase 2C domain-containing protein [Dysgonamonadaceae bacterium]